MAGDVYSITNSLHEGLSLDMSKLSIDVASGDNSEIHFEQSRRKNIQASVSTVDDQLNNDNSSQHDTNLEKSSMMYSVRKTSKHLENCGPKPPSSQHKGKVKARNELCNQDQKSLDYCALGLPATLYETAQNQIDDPIRLYEECVEKYEGSVTNLLTSLQKYQNSMVHYSSCIRAYSNCVLNLEMQMKDLHNYLASDEQLLQAQKGSEENIQVNNTAIEEDATYDAEQCLQLFSRDVKSKPSDISDRDDISISEITVASSTTTISDSHSILSSLRTDSEKCSEKSYCSRDYKKTVDKIQQVAKEIYELVQFTDSEVSIHFNDKSSQSKDDVKKYQSSKSVYKETHSNISVTPKVDNTTNMRGSYLLNSFGNNKVFHTCIKILENGQLYNDDSKALQKIIISDTDYGLRETHSCITMRSNSVENLGRHKSSPVLVMHVQSQDLPCEDKYPSDVPRLLNSEENDQERITSIVASPSITNPQLRCMGDLMMRQPDNSFLTNLAPTIVNYASPLQWKDHYYFSLPLWIKKSSPYAGSKYSLKYKLDGNQQNIFNDIIMKNMMRCCKSTSNEQGTDNEAGIINNLYSSWNVKDSLSIVRVGLCQKLEEHNKFVLDGNKYKGVCFALNDRHNSTIAPQGQNDISQGKPKDVATTVRKYNSKSTSMISKMSLPQYLAIDSLAQIGNKHLSGKQDSAIALTKKDVVNFLHIRNRLLTNRMMPHILVHQSISDPSMGLGTGHYESIVLAQSKNFEVNNPCSNMLISILGKECKSIFDSECSRLVVPKSRTTQCTLEMNSRLAMVKSCNKRTSPHDKHFACIALHGPNSVKHARNTVQFHTLSQISFQQENAQNETASGHQTKNESEEKTADMNQPSAMQESIFLSIDDSLKLASLSTYGKKTALHTQKTETFHPASSEYIDNCALLQNNEFESYNGLLENRDCKKSESSCTIKEIYRAEFYNNGSQSKLTDYFNYPDISSPTNNFQGVNNKQIPEQKSNSNCLEQVKGSLGLQLKEHVKSEEKSRRTNHQSRTINISQSVVEKAQNFKRKPNISSKNTQRIDFHRSGDNIVNKTTSSEQNSTVPTFQKQIPLKNITDPNYTKNKFHLERRNIKLQKPQTRCDSSGTIRNSKKSTNQTPVLFGSSTQHNPGRAMGTNNNLLKIKQHHELVNRPKCKMQAFKTTGHDLRHTQMKLSTENCNTAVVTKASLQANKQRPIIAIKGGQKGMKYLSKLFESSLISQLARQQSSTRIAAATFETGKMLKLSSSDSKLMMLCRRRVPTTTVTSAPHKRIVMIRNYSDTGFRQSFRLGDNETHFKHPTEVKGHFLLAKTSGFAGSNGKALEQQTEKNSIGQSTFADSKSNLANYSKATCHVKSHTLVKSSACKMSHKRTEANFSTTNSKSFLDNKVQVRVNGLEKLESHLTNKKTFNTNTLQTQVIKGSGTNSQTVHASKSLQAFLKVSNTHIPRKIWPPVRIQNLGTDNAINKTHMQKMDHKHQQSSLLTCKSTTGIAIPNQVRAHIQPKFKHMGCYSFAESTKDSFRNMPSRIPKQATKNENLTTRFKALPELTNITHKVTPSISLKRATSSQNQAKHSIKLTNPILKTKQEISNLNQSKANIAKKELNSLDDAKTEETSPEKLRDCNRTTNCAGHANNNKAKYEMQKCMNSGIPQINISISNLATTETGILTTTTANPSIKSIMNKCTLLRTKKSRIPVSARSATKLSIIAKTSGK